MDSWIKTPFESHFINLKRQNSQTNLHFAISGLTQQGVEHNLENQNNQDATGIIIEENFIAGIVCDGCSGTSHTLQNSNSNNEIGAKLTVRILIKAIKKAYEKKNLSDGFVFLQTVRDCLIREFKGIVDIVCEHNEEDKQIFIVDFLLTTTYCVVVDEKNYVVFYCGDGVIGINENIEVINESRQYLSTNLLKICCPIRYGKVEINEDLKIYSYGDSSELKSIFIATDGFNEIASGFKNQLLNFIKSEQTKNGFFEVKPDFRSKILEHEGISKEIGLKNWLRDDASFVLLKKINLPEKSQ